MACVQCLLLRRIAIVSVYDLLASDRSDKENVCVCCVGMSTVNKSSSKAAVTTPIVESSLELQKTMSPEAGTALNVFVRSV